MSGAAVGDSTFEATVMDKSKDVFVLFYKNTVQFCDTNASAYGDFAQSVESSSTLAAVHMNVDKHKSPFVFEDEELPVIMLFPASDKRPLEFDAKLTAEELHRFAREHGSNRDGAEGDDEDGSEETPSAKAEL